MILYNVTVKIAHAVHEEWVEWMQNVHIPEVMETGLFLENKFCRLLGDDNEHGITYAIQYLCPDQKTFQIYQQLHAERLQKDHAERYGEHYAAFRTLLEVIHQTTHE